VGSDGNKPDSDGITVKSDAIQPNSDGIIIKSDGIIHSRTSAVDQDEHINQIRNVFLTELNQTKKVLPVKRLTHSLITCKLHITSTLYHISEIKDSENNIYIHT
jgi:hypothetical protein